MYFSLTLIYDPISYQVCIQALLCVHKKCRTWSSPGLVVLSLQPPYTVLIECTSYYNVMINPSISYSACLPHSKWSRLSTLLCTWQIADLQVMTTPAPCPTPLAPGVGTSWPAQSLRWDLSRPTDLSTAREGQISETVALLYPAPRNK